MGTSGEHADHRPRVAVRFRGARQDVELPIVRLEQRANGRWYAVVELPRWSDDGHEVVPWNEQLTLPPGSFRQLPGEDYSALKRVRHPNLSL